MFLHDYLTYANLVYGMLSKLPVDVVLDYKDNSKTLSLAAVMEIADKKNFDVKILSDSIDMGSDKITIFLEVEDG